MLDYESLVHSLSDPDIKLSDYKIAIKKIADKVDEIWRFICREFDLDLKWWSFSNDEDGDDGNGTSGGSFDPKNDSEYIEIYGERNCSSFKNFEYEYGFPTRFLWEDYKKEVMYYHKDLIAKQKLDKKMQKESRKTKSDKIENLKTKLKSILKKEEFDLLKFK